MILSLFQSIFSKRKIAPKTSKIAKAQLVVESLESRVVPTAWIYTGTTPGNWSDGANWDSGVAPSIGGTAVFDAGDGPCNYDGSAFRVGKLILNNYSSTLYIPDNFMVTQQLVLAGGEIRFTSSAVGHRNLYIYNPTGNSSWTSGTIWGEANGNSDPGSIQVDTTLTISGSMTTDHNLAINSSPGIYGGKVILSSANINFYRPVWTSSSNGFVSIAEEAALRVTGTSSMLNTYETFAYLPYIDNYGEVKVDSGESFTDRRAKKFKLFGR